MDVQTHLSFYASESHHPTSLKSAIRFTTICLRPLGHPRPYCPSSQSKVCQSVSNAWGGQETTSPWRFSDVGLWKHSGHNEQNIPIGRVS